MLHSAAKQPKTGLIYIGRALYYIWAQFWAVLRRCTTWQHSLNGIAKFRCIAAVYNSVLMYCTILVWCLLFQCCLFCSVACVAVLLVLQCSLYCSVAVLFVLQYCMCCSIACVAVLHNTGQKKKCSMVWHTLHCRHFKRCFRSWIFILSLPSTCSLNCIFCFFTYICKIKHNFWRRQYAWLGLLLIAKKRT